MPAPKCTATARSLSPGRQGGMFTAIITSFPVGVVTQAEGAIVKGSPNVARKVRGKGGFVEQFEVVGGMWAASTLAAARVCLAAAPIQFH
jgi:hypothetical protein